MMDFKPLIGLTPSEFAFQIINTFLVFVLLKKFLFKPVMNIVEARENDIQSNLAEGERNRAEGIAFKKEYEEKIQSAKSEGQEIIKQATLRAEQKSEEILSGAHKEVDSLRENASKEIKLEKQKAMNEIKNDISDIALLAASKVIEKDIDKSKHKDLIDNFIKEVGEVK